ncbi:hypothetical protein [Pseudomonas phage phiPSA1]|uniref:Uncharacterized protein n=1 Tax=Pseudomonas phage phiPSA1 TaxID=1500757 RepID=A0A059VJT4_9CAUD|nr:hypothetical protein HH36_gp19 [Pseudomonas phage phiPSA1]AHZ95046.1 hypothetical protein [Pseudomonas phage phiPSA1]
MDLVIDVAVHALLLQRLVHGLHASAVLVALARPRRIEVNALPVITVPFLDVARQLAYRRCSHAWDWDNHSIKVGAAAVIGAGRCGCLTGFNGNRDLWAEACKFLFGHCVTRLNSTTQTHGLTSHAPAPLIESHK